MQQNKQAARGLNEGRRQFLRQGGVLLASLPLLGISPLRQRLFATGANDSGYRTYRDPDLGFTLRYPAGWQTEVKEQQPVPLLDDEAILKRVVFSSHPALVYLDIWLAKGKNFTDWLSWYKETRLVEQMPTQANAKVAGQLATSFLQEHQRDLMITYFSDGKYVYRVMNWMTGDRAHLDAYWHMLDTFTLSVRSSLVAAEIPMQIRQEGVRAAERSRGMRLLNECCEHNDSGNPFPCCGCENCNPCCNQEGNCTWWVYYKYGSVPFTGNANTWWGQAIDYAGWDTSNAPSTCVPSIGCWNTGQFGHVAYAASYSGGGTVNISDMSWCDHCDETDNISISDPNQGWVYLSWICT